MSLTAQIDQLSRNARTIKSICNKTGTLGHLGGPFTRAVLHTQLGDLIREIDPSELGLFTLQGANSETNSQQQSSVPADPEIKRVEFHGATPLRRPRPRDEAPKSKEVEPEVYAEAALKYLDRYQPIRPMPRAHAQVVAILEQIGTVRENMRTLARNLEQLQTAEAPQAKQLADAEEKRVEELKERISYLKKRKEEAIKQQKSKRTIPPLTKRPPKPKPVVATPRTPEIDVREETFWSTPAPSARVLHFGNTSSLLDETGDHLADMSIMSFGSSPTGPPRTKAADDPVSPETEPEEEGDSLISDITVDGQEGLVVEPEDDEQDLDDEENEDEKTVVLRKLAPKPETPPRAATPPSETPVQNPKTPKVRITNEVERIVSKIWQTAGDLIMPGHSFDTSPGSGSNLLPRAKETIAHLQSVSSQLPSSLLSPSTSISSSETTSVSTATPAEILTSYLLLSLLLSPPHYSLSLGKVKEILGAKSASFAGGGGGTMTITRPLYACAAKKLLKIERGGGEQVVKFDL